MFCTDVGAAGADGQKQETAQKSLFHSKHWAANSLRTGGCQLVALIARCRRLKHAPCSRFRSELTGADVSTRLRLLLLQLHSCRHNRDNMCWQR